MVTSPFNMDAIGRALRPNAVINWEFVKKCSPTYHVLLAGPSGIWQMMIKSSKTLERSRVPSQIAAYPGQPVARGPSHLGKCRLLSPLS